MIPASLQTERGKWDERDLIRRLCHALDIARIAVEQLAVEGYTDHQDPSRNIRPEKIISETAVLLVAASSAMVHPEVETRIRHVAELLIPHARCDRALLGLCLEPAVALDYALPHVCLSRLDYHDYQFDKLLRASLESQARCGRERVPHRVLEQEWVATGWYQPKPGRRLACPPSARRAAPGQPMDLLACTRDDIYAFTHALMYVTDFNLIPALPPRRRSIILTEAEALLAHCLDEQDYDLSGEVLLSWPLTGKVWSAASSFAFRVLAHVEDKAGFLPTPSTRISEIKARESVERRQYLVATAYHTAYVMGLVCAASLQPGFAPPASVPATDTSRGRAKHILKLLDADGKRPHWQDEFRQLAEPEAEALAGFLLNVALRRRVATRDFKGLRDLLKLAYDLDLANAPAASQAAELLQRLAIYAEITTEPDSEPAPNALGSGAPLRVSPDLKPQDRSSAA
ncbi:MAG: hypothetical protein WBX22_00215 [Silvibacterium sp.]